MKILHIISGLSTGGAERMLVKLIQNDYSDAKHIVISLKDKGVQGAILESNGVKVYSIDIKSVLPSLKNISYLRRLIRDVNPDLIQGWMYHGNLAALLASSSIPVVFNIRQSLSDIKNDKLTTKWVIKLNSLLSNKADGIIYNSYLSKKQHVKYGFNESKSIVISNGFDSEVFDIDADKRKSLRTELNLREDEIVFCQIGRDHPVKDHPNYIKAASITLEHYKKSHFILVGEGVDVNENLQHQIKVLNLEENFTLLGERSDISKIWNGADIAVLSSVSEAFPNVLGEAMLCGKSCVATNVGDANLIIGETGKMVPPQDSVSLAKSMLEMALLSKMQRVDLGRVAREKIINEFEIKKVSNEYIKFYSSLIK